VIGEIGKEEFVGELILQNEEIAADVQSYALQAFILPL
jgi:hypothetical protein